jgi:hypothetical protein
MAERRKDLLGLARALDRLGELEEAIDVFDRAVSTACCLTAPRK